MNNIESGDENKFTLDYYLAKEQTAEPPFNYRSNYLADAVAEGWRIHLNGDDDTVSHERESVFSEDELPEIFNRMAELESGQSGLSPKEIAEQAIQKTGKNV